MGARRGEAWETLFSAVGAVPVERPLSVRCSPSDGFTQPSTAQVEGETGGWGEERRGVGRSGGADEMGSGTSLMPRNHRSADSSSFSSNTGFFLNSDVTSSNVSSPSTTPLPPIPSFASPAFSSSAVRSPSLGRLVPSRSLLLFSISVSMKTFICSSMRSLLSTSAWKEPPISRPPMAVWGGGEGEEEEEEEEGVRVERLRGDVVAC